jgi:stage V sporulation protein B
VTQPEDARSAARNARRGVLSITTAKLYFIVAGYAVQFLLPRLLGSPEAFGLFSSAMNVVSILNNVLITATVQTVSRQVSEDAARAPATLRQGLLIQLAIGALLACGLWAGAPALGGRVLLDAQLGKLIAVSSIVVFCYAPYAALIGSLNGRQIFATQAKLDMTFTTLRTCGILGAAALGWGALGAIGGFAAAASCVLLVALFTVGTGTGAPAGTIAWRQWLGWMAPLWLYHALSNMALLVDLNVIKATVASLQLDAGMSTQAAAEAASRLAGFYRAAQTFAFVPYQLILSVTFVVFPMVSQAVSIGDEAASRRYIHNAMRFSLIVLLAIAAPVSGAAAGVMRIAYPNDYLAGSDALAVLSLGIVCFALFVIGATILSSAGRPGLSAAIAAGAVALVIGGNLVLVHLAGIGPHTLRAAATGTSVGMAFAVIAVGFAVRARFGTFMQARSVLRVLTSALFAWIVAHALPNHGVALAVLALAAGGIAFLVALIATRELGADDWAVLKKLARRA